MPNDARTTASRCCGSSSPRQSSSGWGPRRTRRSISPTPQTPPTSPTARRSSTGAGPTALSSRTGRASRGGTVRPLPSAPSCRSHIPGRRPHPDVIDDPRTLSPDVFPGHSLAPDGLPHGSRPAPVLLKLWPRSGPVEGGTELTIRGSGFARTGRGRVDSRGSSAPAPASRTSSLPARYHPLRCDVRPLTEALPAWRFSPCLPTARGTPERRQ